MSMWTAIALIAVASIIAGIFNDKGKKENHSKLKSEIDSLNERIEDLEGDLRHRIETLERIVTSPKEELKRQFDHLDKAS